MTDDRQALSDEVKAEIDALRRDGRLHDAAERCLAAGAIVRASELFAECWEHERAIEVAESAGALDVAYRHALSANDRNAARTLLARLTEHPDLAVRAARFAESKGLAADAARLLESAGDVSEAAERYERAGELFEAARCREADGKYRDAGLLYERRLRESPDDAEAALRLGRLLAGFGRYEHAVRALQVAAEDDDRRDAALRTMIACFAALGWDDAAGARLDELRRLDPATPVTVPELLTKEHGDPRGLLARGASDREAELLGGRYRVLRSLGAGATGRVLLAHDGFYDRDVAVKVLTVGTGALGRDAYVRFAREARVAAGIEHPNVVHVFEFNADGPYLVMEHMPGGTLEDRLAVANGQPLPLPVIRHVLLSVLAGLEVVHRRGVVHRDMKPANVFFGATGDVKIGDFGVAHLTDIGSTLTGAMLGTLAYMAPEQITGSHRPDASTDFYALGVILFRMLTGQLPFPGPDFVTQHLESEAPVPSASGAPSDAYDALVATLLEKEQGARPRTAGDVRALVVALPWDPPDATALELATGVPEEREARPSSVPPPAPSDDRYVLLDPLPDGGMRAKDGILGRTVRIEPCDDARAARLRAFARADSPHLQAVYDVDREAGRAVLEEPAGRPLTEAFATLSEPARARALAELRAAVAHAHELGVVHGAIDPAHVILGRGRAVLLLPEGTDAPTDAQRDLDALEELARTLG
jgi:serine/threonine-protein kinase